MTTARYFELKMMLLQLEFVEEVIVREEFITDDFGYLCRMRMPCCLKGGIMPLITRSWRVSRTIYTMGKKFYPLGQ